MRNWSLVRREAPTTPVSRFYGGENYRETVPTDAPAADSEESGNGTLVP